MMFDAFCVIKKAAIFFLLNRKCNNFTYTIVYKVSLLSYNYKIKHPSVGNLYFSDGVLCLATLTLINGFQHFHFLLACNALAAQSCRNHGSLIIRGGRVLFSECVTTRWKTVNIECYVCLPRRNICG